MNKNYNLLLKWSFCCWLCIANWTNVIAQNPFKLLQQVPILIEKKAYQKALNEIDRAINLDYCTCGTCREQIESEAYYLKAQIYQQQNKISAALIALDGIVLGFMRDLDEKANDLRVKLYQKQYGAANLAAQIDTAISSASLYCDENLEKCKVILPLKGSRNSLYWLLRPSLSLYCISEPAEVILTKWRADFLKSAAYSLPEERFLMWNFVSHSKDRLKTAKAAWAANEFPKVPSDTTYIPFPELKKP